MSRLKYTDEQFIETVKTSTSIRQVLSKLNLKEAGSNYKVAKQKIEKHGNQTIEAEGMVSQLLADNEKIVEMFVCFR